MAQRRSKNPFIAAALSFLAPGVGHLYVGAAWRGFGTVLGVVATVVLAGQLGLLSTIPGYFATALLLLSMNLGLCVDAARIARRRGDDYRPRGYERWWVYSVAAVLVVGGWYGLSSIEEVVLGHKLLRVPAPSMAPALNAGDWVLIDTRYCRGECEPERGLIVAFEPGGDLEGWYLKRVAGVGGDTLEMVRGVLRVNGAVTEGPFSRPIRIQRIWRGARPEFDPILVPEGEIFVLGDNLERSVDSRLIGTVPYTSIRGRLTSVLWHASPSRDERPRR